MAAELLSSSKARAVIMEFWNSDEMGISCEGIKTVKTALAAIHDCGLVGKIKAVRRDDQLYLINLEKTPHGTE